MIRRLIEWSVHNRILVLLVTVIVTGWGIASLWRTPIDAIPDLSDVQVIVKTTYPGQSPQVVEDQITYPVTTAMLAVPGATTVRGFSMFGDSFVYILFKDGTDIYWARSRVLEQLTQVIPRLPRGARAELGPDATGVGWIYAYALIDRSGKHDLSQLRAYQDWVLRFELRTVPGVSEVASVGGMVRQYQVVVDPERLRAYRLRLSDVRRAISRANREAGGSIVELAEAEYMVRVRGYLKGLDDLRAIPLGVGSTGAPILLRHVADIRVGPELRRGIAELNGQGEVTGGIIVMRHGGNAQETLRAVRAKIDDLRANLPPGVELVTTYDRGGLIERSVKTLTSTLVEEFIVVAVVCLAFLFHLRSSLVAIVTLPIGVLTAFIVMRYQGITANIMSLGGIAIGAMVDAAIVMIENTHKHMEQEPGARRHPWTLIVRSCQEVGPPLFFSLLIITVSFLPVFALEAQEGRLFSPLAYTKTYAMAAAAGLSVTLVPVLMGYFIRGRLRPEKENPINRWLLNTYRPLLEWTLKHSRAVLWGSAVLIVIGLYPALRLGSEFMPDMNEGDLLYMPTTLPGLSPGKAQQLLQQTGRILKSFPEVETVFGKAGRAATATDPAPMSMFETTVRLKPRDQWRPGMTLARLTDEMRAAVRIPGLPDVFVMPIKTRIDMLTTGIRSPVGIKVHGDDLSVIDRVTRQIETAVRQVPGTASAFAERLGGARYIEIIPNRAKLAQFGLNMADIEEVIASAVGGLNVTETVDGRQRFPVNIRYPQSWRDSPDRLRRLPIHTATGIPIPLGEVADVRIVDGPDMIRSENARLTGWVSIDFTGRDLGSYVADLQKAVREQVKLPAGYSLSWTGQYEYLERATARLRIVVPFTLAIILLLLYLNFRNPTEVLIIVVTLPLALVGGVWLMWALDYRFSVAAAVGFIALGGVAVEIGVVMLTYLDLALRRREKERHARGEPLSMHDLHEAIVEGALLRIRPVTMTKVAIIAALLPILWSNGTGAEAMSRIAAPMVGGMLNVALLTLVVIPAAYWEWQRRRLRRCQYSPSTAEAA